MALTYDPFQDGQKLVDLTFMERYGALNYALNEIELAGPGYSWDIEQQTGAFSMTLDGLGYAAVNGYNENGAENVIYNHAETFVYTANPYSLGYTMENLSMDMDWGDNRALDALFDATEMAGPGLAWDIEQQTGSISRVLDNLAFVGTNGFDEAAENRAEAFVRNHAETFIYNANPFATGFALEQFSMDLDGGDAKTLDVMLDTIEMAGPGMAWDIEHQTGSLSRTLDNLSFAAVNGFDEYQENRAENLIAQHAETFVYNSNAFATGFAMEQLSMDMDGGDRKALDAVLDVVEMAGPGLAWDIEWQTGSLSRMLDNLSFAATNGFDDVVENNAEVMIRDHAETFVYNANPYAVGFTMEQLSMDMDGGDTAALRAIFNSVEQAGPGLAWDIEQGTGSISRTMDNLSFVATNGFDERMENRAENLMHDFADEFVFNANLGATGFTLDQLSRDGDWGDRRAVDSLLGAIQDGGNLANEIEWQTGAISRTLDNFVFHATAAQGLEDGSEAIITKYADLFAQSANPYAVEFGIEALRMDGDKGDLRAANALESAFEQYYPHDHFDFV